VLLSFLLCSVVLSQAAPHVHEKSQVPSDPNLEEKADGFFTSTLEDTPQQDFSEDAKDSLEEDGADVSTDEDGADLSTDLTTVDDVVPESQLATANTKITRADVYAFASNCSGKALLELKGAESGECYPLTRGNKTLGHMMVTFGNGTFDSQKYNAELALGQHVYTVGMFKSTDKTCSSKREPVAYITSGGKCAMPDETHGDVGNITSMIAGEPIGGVMVNPTNGTTFTAKIVYGCLHNDCKTGHDAGKSKKSAASGAAAPTITFLSTLAVFAWWSALW